MRASTGSAGRAAAWPRPCRSRGRRQPGAVAGLVGVAAVMGPYDPRAAVCPLATLTAKGPQACLR